MCNVIKATIVGERVRAFKIPRKGVMLGCSVRGTMRAISNVNSPHLISQIRQMTRNQTEDRPTIFNQD